MAKRHFCMADGMHRTYVTMIALLAIDAGVRDAAHQLLAAVAVH